MHVDVDDVHVCVDVFICILPVKNKSRDMVGKVAEFIHLASDNVETAFAVAAVDEQPNFHGLLPLLFTI